MDAALKEKWVKALRSGEYEQHRGGMCDEGQTKFCCLGVLAKVLGEPITSNQMLPFSSIKIFGTFPHSKLASMNDGSNGVSEHSFAEIADYIEANIPGE